MSDLKHYTFMIPKTGTAEATLGFLCFFSALCQKGNVIIVKKFEVTNSDESDEEGNPLECAIVCHVALDKINP